MKNKIKILITILIAVIISGYSGNHDKYSESGKHIEEYLNESMQNGFSGAVLVARKNEILVNNGYGFAVKENETPNSPETIYDICSVTKQFTAAAILKLAEAEKLDLTDSISMYFQNIPKDKRGITIHQLLTHSAGFVHGIGESDFDQMPEEEYFKELLNSKLLFAPGTQYEYSNAGYSILARIIELVSGKDYEEFVNEELFTPAGMTQTGYLLPKWNKEKIADEYLYNVSNEGSHINHYMRDGKIAWTLKGNGGINSTNEDMYKWYLALNSNKILSAEYLEKLTHPYVPENKDSTSYYAYGWAIFKSGRNTKVITHNGFNGITYYEFVWFPEEEAVILFASNSATPEVSRMTLEIENMLFDENYTAEPLSKNRVGELYSFAENYNGSIDKLSEEIKKQFGEKIDSPNYLNRLGGIYLRKQNFPKAIAVMKLNTQIFPDDGNLWDSLGEAFMAAGKNEPAIKSFEKALNLKPKDGDCFWCGNSRKNLKQLGSKIQEIE